MKVRGSSDVPVNINQTVQRHIPKLFAVTILMSAVGVGLRGSNVQTAPSAADSFETSIIHCQWRLIIHLEHDSLGFSNGPQSS